MTCFMKLCLLTLLAGFMTSGLLCAQSDPMLYNPAAPADKEIRELLAKAKKEKKNVLLMAGGNWCKWCTEFDNFSKNDRLVDSLLKADYLFYHLNYSPENRNTTIFARYGYPQRFGFPVFIVLDENGNRLHTQKSGYLEQGRSFSTRKVSEFLTGWNRKALDPSQY
jgi:thioredoxin-related protein